ncbi:hypothetical protein T492DRAFT_1073550 [Pavlovales sp. CCMP2436]|nr:hypothetical protein T492DRAFT_1073550 [Pavlovales sp. CCMP2436]
MVCWGGSLAILGAAVGQLAPPGRRSGAQRERGTGGTIAWQPSGAVGPLHRDGRGRGGGPLRLLGQEPAQARRLRRGVCDHRPAVLRAGRHDDRARSALDGGAGRAWGACRRQLLEAARVSACRLLLQDAQNAAIRAAPAARAVRPLPRHRRDPRRLDGGVPPSPPRRLIRHTTIDDSQLVR